MKILYITTVGGTMPFFTTLIHSLIGRGDAVDIAANVSDSDVPACYREWGCRVYPLSCERSPLAAGNVRAVREIREIVSGEHYDIVHCHTPIAAACTRIACRGARKRGTKVFYTAHGFHFFKGAPLKNWLLFYPVEWLCAHWTDVLITINREDYERAQKRLHAKRVEYVPGVGVDIQKFASNALSADARAEKRAKLGLRAGDRLLLSVGELNQNKNHETVIRALAKCNDATLHYAIAGAGELKGYLTELSEQLGVGDRVHLLGYRTDVAELYRTADLFIHPSLREGLPVAVMEALASGVPVICSNTRGNADLVCAENLFSARDVDGIAEKIEARLSLGGGESALRDGEGIQKYSMDSVNARMKALYDDERVATE